MPAEAHRLGRGDEERAGPRAPERVEQKVDIPHTQRCTDGPLGLDKLLPIPELGTDVAQQPGPHVAPQVPQTVFDHAAGGRDGRGRADGKPRLGVTVSTLSNTNGQFPNGAYIVNVEAGSPAEKAGLKPGDILVELNGEVISNTSDLMNGLEGLQEGDTVTVTVWRPDEVEDAQNGAISYAGQYIENIEVSLAILDNM